MSEFCVGDRVRLEGDLPLFPIGTFPHGAVGTVTEVCAAASTGLLGLVRLDDYYPTLALWGNELQVQEDGECTWDSFRKVEDPGG